MTAALVAAVWLVLAVLVAVGSGRAARLAEQRQPAPHLRLIRDETPTSPPTARSGEEGRRRGHMHAV